MTTIKRAAIGYSVGLLGIALALFTLGFHFWWHVAHVGEAELDFLLVPLMSGAVLGWWGFYWAEPKRATEGGGFLLDAVERWKRAGRRNTDPMMPVPAPIPAAPPVPVVVPPQSDWEHGDDLPVVPVIPVGKQIPGEGD